MKRNITAANAYYFMHPQGRPLEEWCTALNLPMLRRIGNTRATHNTVLEYGLCGTGRETAPIPRGYADFSLSAHERVRCFDIERLIAKARDHRTRSEKTLQRVEVFLRTAAVRRLLEGDSST